MGYSVKPRQVLQFRRIGGKVVGNTHRVAGGEHGRVFSSLHVVKSRAIVVEMSLPVLNVGSQVLLSGRDHQLFQTRRHPQVCSYHRRRADILIQRRIGQMEPCSQHNAGRARDSHHHRTASGWLHSG